MSLSLRDPQTMVGLLAAGAVIAGIGYSVMKKKPDPQLIEKQRRTDLVRAGRIVDGTLLDVREVDSEEAGLSHTLRLLIYQYEIGGVTYECSQDIAPLGDHVDIHAIRVGFPCSVRYQPNNPQNSILVAETWSGLRDRDAFTPVEETLEDGSFSRSPV